jgi:hypothetical protein
MYLYASKLTNDVSIISDDVIYINIDVSYKLNDVINISIDVPIK